MTDFGKWARGPTLASVYSSSQAQQRIRDLANLVAQLEDAASPFEALQEKATDPRVGLRQPVTVAEAEALNDALAACQEFMEKYA
ncbi:hypothetical protein LCGC14_2974190 [marine sediment metagenome]|uniref:Uncharacterized protein n=1 Tax=marine sediment metagenome TaxID=412755 RepID=A0A0F8ZZR9_9ZZZZ